MAVTDAANNEYLVLHDTPGTICSEEGSFSLRNAVNRMLEDIN